MCKAEISGRAANLVSTVNDDIHAELIDGESLIGGGSAPSATLPTTIIALSSRTMSAETLSARLRFASPPVVARVEDGRVLLDLRTVFPEQDERVREILAGIAAN